MNISAAPRKAISSNYGSTDSSGEICDLYAKNENVKVIHKENGGLSSARNAGMAIADGDLLFFVDSDDYISKDTLEIMTDIYTDTNADVVVANFSHKEEDLARRKGWQYVPLLVLAVVLNTNSGIYGAILSAKKKSKAMAISSVIGIAVNLVLNIVLINLIGLQGATIASVVSSFVILILRKIIVGEKYKTKWEKHIYLCFVLVAIQSLIKIYAKFSYSVFFELIIFGIIICIFAFPVMNILLRKGQK